MLILMSRTELSQSEVALTISHTKGRLNKTKNVKLGLWLNLEGEIDGRDTEQDPSKR